MADLMVAMMAALKAGMMVDGLVASRAALKAERKVASKES